MSKKLHVLVADDDRAIVDAISLYLEFEGYDVSTTYDGNSLLNLVSPFPDVIILDIWMSGVDGLQICRQLKQDPKRKQIPILIMSASRDLKPSAEAAGADGSISKPFDMQELIDHIVRLGSRV
ncbi:two-component system, OmpR family, alkaline phosphatase synthesis response regulator PhoP/two-component system, OmpR family, response regulator VicR [bacterium A37T11]|nr:two-component system, OmpR family, alkaline phosphatase synthesis response regulator PhoP/two-component system, OmpR family, response regulator VicR [bacterium A37T11]